MVERGWVQVERELVCDTGEGTGSEMYPFSENDSGMTPAGGIDESSLIGGDRLSCVRHVFGLCSVSLPINGEVG